LRIVSQEFFLLLCHKGFLCFLLDAKEYYEIILGNKNTFLLIAKPLNLDFNKSLPEANLNAK